MARDDKKSRIHLEVVSSRGAPSPEDLDAARAALEKVIATERAAQAPSMWLRYGRARGRRLGMYDYRDRFNSDDAWRLSLRLPGGGREYPGLIGRGDAR
ncbi:MAG TPA: hypothetical protein VNC78_12490 [Actinomycetota bacterium]|nr:hypothetical protein [Actinomycetota bacterium]